MTNERVDAVISAYLDFLDGTGSEPSLEQLTPDERALAQDFMDSLKAGRGIDPYQSRPSLNSLLAGTEFESWLTPPATEGLTIDAIRTDVMSSLGSGVGLCEDGAAITEGLRSNAVITIDGTRLRIQFRDDLSSPELLAQVNPQAAAGPVYGRFPDTASVILVIGDAEFSSVSIGPFDIDDCIGAPDGQVRAPSIYRPVLPLHDTLRACLEEVAPDLSASGAAPVPQYLGIEDVAQSEAADAVGDIVAEGKKARTAAKTETWAEMNGAEIDMVRGIVLAVSTGELDSSELGPHIERSASAA